MFYRTASLLVLGVLCHVTALHSQSPLTTTFAQNNGDFANLFDLKSLTGVILTDFDVNAFAATTTTVEVWARNAPGSYIGSGEENDPTKWSLLASVPNLSVAVGVPNNLGLALNQTMVAGETRAFAIGFRTGTIGYTNGTTEGALYSSNTDLEFFEGRGGSLNSASTWLWPNSPRVWNGNIYYMPISTFSDDVQLAAITSPVDTSVDCSARPSGDNVTIELRALGLNPIPIGSLFFVSYQVDGGTPVSEIVAVINTMNQGDVISHTFATQANLSAIGNHVVTAKVTYAGDSNPANDSLSVQINSGGALRVTSFPHVEDFAFAGTPSDLPLGWFQDPGDNTDALGDWIMHDSSTSTAGTGPSADHTTGIAGTGGFIYVDGDSTANQVNVRSPCFDLTMASNPTLRFFLHSDGNFSPSNTLAIDVLDDAGALTMNALAPTGHLGNQWQQMSVDLTPFVGKVIQLILRVDAEGTSNPAHDVAIDDLSVIELLPSIGQAWQPGAAVLDIHNAQNVNGDLVSFGFGGPYFATLSAGDLLTFEMEGEPGQAIILITGPLNPVAASYPGIGKLDIGGPIDPFTGIPTLISVMADGTKIGGFNPFFLTSANGRCDVGFSVPALPPGVLGTFQCLFLRSAAPGMALSNAIQVTIM